MNKEQFNEQCRDLNKLFREFDKIQKKNEGLIRIIENAISECKGAEYVLERHSFTEAYMIAINQLTSISNNLKWALKEART
jgi:SMC interacting uncharacterized protein involved in chromosome segregation